MGGDCRLEVDEHVNYLIAEVCDNKSENYIVCLIIYFLMKYVGNIFRRHGDLKFLFLFRGGFKMHTQAQIQRWMF